MRKFMCLQNEDEAIEKFKDGDILVIPFATQKIIGILKKSSAIICEHSDTGSYAAVAGQVLGRPVIVGAAGATKILHSGTAVTVDSKKGLVFCSGNG